MKLSLLIACVLSALSFGHSLPRAESEPFLTESDRTVHIFVLMVPDSTVQALRNKARQEEEAGVDITETGVYVGQIISGVLGGDVRPIFAGSASFIDEPDVQQGVSTILANVAPSLNNILKGWFNRVQTALGITSTIRPGTANGTISNGQVAGQPLVGPNGQPLTQQQLQQLTPEQLQQLSQQQQQQQQQPSQQSQSVVFPSENNNKEPTTVEPLPLIKLKQPDEDNEEESDNLNKVKVA